MIWDLTDENEAAMQRLGTELSMTAGAAHAKALRQSVGGKSGCHIQGTAPRQCGGGRSQGGGIVGAEIKEAEWVKCYI